MNETAIRQSICEALAAIVQPRFFETERGFQGQFLLEFGKRLRLTDQAIIEQEHQKTLLAHGLNLRPDVILHEPFDPVRHRTGPTGNLAIIAFKLDPLRRRQVRTSRSSGR